MSRYFVFFVVICITMLLESGAGWAQVQPADDPCDPEYYGSLKARAWLEAEREIVQNQNLIFKPDSVLEYTCFDKYLDELADHAIDMFSETTRWGTILPSDSMDNALDDLVGYPTYTFVQSNFSHDFLGGRMRGSNYVPDTVAGGTYSCNVMNRVWMHAKCMDFIDDPDTDGFFTFEEYANASQDKRQLPNACSKSGLWQQNINDAYESVPWTEDDLETYLDNLDAGQCGAIPPIPTGLQVDNANFDGPYQEMVCIQPGCHFRVERVQNNLTEGCCVSALDPNARCPDD